MKSIKKHFMLFGIFSWIFLSLGCDNIGNAHLFKKGFQSPYTNEDYPPGTVINSYTLPPEPDHKENDKTLLGIDVDRDGVRDDVERYIIIKSSLSCNTYQKTCTSEILQWAKAMQTYYGSEDIKEYLAADGCINGLRDYEKEKNININESEVMGGVTNLMINTPERERQRDKLADAFEAEDLRHHTYPHDMTYCTDDIKSFGELP